MEINDIVVGHKYMIYEMGLGEVEILAKAVVGGQDLIWVQQGNETHVVRAKHISIVPFTRSQAVRVFAAKMQIVFNNMNPSSFYIPGVEKELLELISDIDNGLIDWSQE